MLTKIRNKKQENGFSLLELAVAVGIAAIVAAVGVTASTVFVNGSQTKADNYEASADNELLNAEASFDALYGEAGAPVIPASNVILNVGLGETVLGGTFTVTAVGLKVGSNYSVILQSDPIVLASGVVGESGSVSETVTIPADTPAGWHSLTLLVTYADDTPESNVSYFRIGPSGLLEETSETEPIIPVSLTYLNTSFTKGSNYQTLTPTVTDGAGGKTYSLTGTLPEGVLFDSATGIFAGPSASAWNFEAIQVSSGDRHTCAVTTSGGAKCWGANSAGQLGDGTTAQRFTPVDVSGLTSGVASISAGEGYTCAMTTSGGAKCWGANFAGQLGDGTTAQRLTPVNVSGLTSGVASISAGSFHTCAVTTSGGAKCWGSGNFGQIGDGTTAQRLTPVNVSGLTSGVASISASKDFFTCAVTTSGGAKCWGRNGYGQLGDGTTAQRLTPVNVSGLTSGVASISASGVYACAVTTSGGAKCWGANYVGQLGDGTTAQRLTPVNVSGLTSGVASISVHSVRDFGNSTCAVTTSGGAKCWGANSAGQLGDGTTAQRLTPVNVSGLTSGVASITGGVGHACVITTSGAVKCWGNNEQGQTGSGLTNTVFGCSYPYFGADQLDCQYYYDGVWGEIERGASSTTPIYVSGYSPQIGFPANINITIVDGSGSVTTAITLSAN